MLETKNLEYTYEGSTPIRMPDINCKKGDKLLILGQSGSGKTTLLNLVGGLLQVQKGSLLINQVDISNLKGSTLDAFRGKYIGIVFQKPHFVAALNILDNILLAQKLSGQKEDKTRAKDLLQRLNINHLALKKPDQLSVGEQQRANIARAFINKPALVLADEPTSALDDDNCLEVISLIKNAAEHEGAALLIVTHDQRLKDEFNNQVQL